MNKLIAALAIPAFLVGCSNTRGEAVLDPGAAGFYAEVEAAGFNIQNRLDALTVGESVCEALQTNTSEAIALDLMTGAPLVFTSYEDTNLFISAAVGNICNTHNKSKETS